MHTARNSAEYVPAIGPEHAGDHHEDGNQDQDAPRAAVNQIGETSEHGDAARSQNRDRSANSS
jgi:hypothetical protein